MASDAAPPDLIWNPNQPPLPSNDDLWDSPVVCAPVLHINLNYAEPEYRLQFTQTLRERVPQAAVLDIRAHQPTGNAPIPPTVLLSPPHPYEPIRDWFPAFQNFKRRNPGCARYTIIFLDDVHNPHFPYSAEARAVLETYLAPLVLFAAAERRCLIPIHIMGQRHLVFQAAHRTLGPTATEFEVKFWVHRMERQMHSIASTLANTSNRRWLYPNEDEFEMVAVTIRTQYIQWAAQWHCARTTRLDWLRGNGCLPAFIADRVARLVITLWDFKSILKMISYPEGEFGPVMELECKILQQLSGNKQTVLDATIRWLKGIFQYEKNVYVGWVEEEEVTRKRMQCDCQMTALARCMEDVGAWMRDVRIQTQGELHVFEKDLTMNMTWMHRLEELIPRLWEAAVVKKVEYDLDPRRSGDESSSDYDLSSGSDDAADEVDTTEENSHEDNPSDDNNMQDGNPVASDTVQGGLEGENNELTASGEWEDQQPDTTGTNLGPEHPSDDSNMQDEDPVASETVHGGHEHEMDESTASDERENQQPPQPGSTCGKKRKQNSMEGLDALLDHLERQMQDDGDMPGDRPEPDSTPMAQDTSGSTSEDCSQGECKKRCLGLARSEESTEQSSPMDGAGDDSPSLQPEQSEEATDQSSLVNGDENDPPSSQPEQSEEATERSNLVDGDENYPPSLQTKQSAPVNYAWRPTFAIELFTRRPSKGSYREYPLHYQEGMPTPSPLRISVSADDILPEADEPAFGQLN
ncbi:hypothetical protein EJ06DRAFT_553128 [Trichodelitschia bisporula]|uniref:Uncharacterized protein n=1 Tax=Trichodelitschia bisporula TaxID=703511 RepID=A0A6G1I7C1_9PEZI|nr:hypothetical protein EJ06DRAFT_553128 [Trichodelitschia bisporula]